MESHTTELADLERERLEALVKAAFEPGHYHPGCSCPSCSGTRETLEVEDLQFVNTVASAVGSKRVD